MNRRSLLSICTALAAHLRLRQPEGTPAPDLLATDFGAVGDGVADDTAAIQALLATAAAHSRTAIIPQGTYNLSRPIDIADDITLLMHGAVLRCFNPELGEGSYNFDQPMLQIRNRRNVVIEGGELDGRKDAFPETEFKAGIGIYGSRNIILRDIAANRCKGDGFHISTFHAGPDDYIESENVTMERCTADSNHRQGLSIISLITGRVTDCTFTNTIGTNPQSGVDIEPNLHGEHVRDIRFERCAFDDNAGSGFIFSAVDGSADTQHSVSLVDCTMNRNVVWGVWVTNGTSLEFSNCEINDNGDTGFNLLLGANRDILVDRTGISGNGVHGMLVLGFGEGGSVESLHVTNCMIGGNSVQTPGHHMGLSLGDAAIETRMTDLVIRDCVIGDSTGPTQYYGVLFNDATTVTSGQLIGNDLEAGNIHPIGLAPGVTIEISDNAGI